MISSLQAAVVAQASNDPVFSAFNTNRTNAGVMAIMVSLQPCMPLQYDDEIVSKQIIKYVATCTGMHLSLPTSHPSIPSIPSQQVQTLQASEFSDWMSSNGYSFSGTEKVQAFNNFVTNMVSG